MTTGLSAALIARRTIETPGGDFAVRGLSPTDIFAIYRRHTGALAHWFERLQTGGGIALDNSAMIVGTLLDAAPEIMAEVIAAAADKPDLADVARSLSISVQTTALEVIGELTFTQEMPPKKLIETVVRMMGSLTAPTTTGPAT